MADSLHSFIGIALKASMVVALAALAAALLRRRSAAVRHLVWLAALSMLLVLPLAASFMPVWRPDLPAPIESVLPAGRIVVDVVGSGGGRQIYVSIWLWILWATGALAAVLWTVGAHWRAATLARRAIPFPASAAAPVRLTAEVSVPMVCGILRQTIVLPGEASTWASERLRVVLTHESTHVVRHDTLAQVLAQLACALYWPHPLVWWASNQLGKECEQAAAAGVLVEGEKASVYAGHLIDIARGLARPVRVPQGGIQMAGSSELEGRLKAMFSLNRDRRTAGWRPAAAAAVLALCVLLPLAALRAPAQITGGSLSGTVKDASGATVPRASVTLLEIGTERMEFTATNDAGEFRFSPLPEGVYALQVAKPGFARLEQRGIEVSAAKPAVVSLVLNIGKVVENLTVSAESGKSAAVPASAGEKTRIRVGGSVQATKIEAMIQPKYPSDCKTEGVQGTVLLRGTIGRDGTLLKVEPINKLVDQRLVNEAVAAVRQWRYQPTLLNGEPVEVVTEIQINFALK